MSLAALAALFAVGYMESRHDKDVAAQQAAQAAADEGDDEGDFTDPEYATASARSQPYLQSLYDVNKSAHKARLRRQPV